MNAVIKKSVGVLALLFFVCMTGFTQTRNTELRGRVTEENGEPVVGAAIYYEGTSTSALTDANGEFSLPFLKGQNLVFSMFGMKQESVRPSDNRYLNVIMSPDNMTLDDAVVIGYGTTSRRDLTGSVASVKAEDIVATGSNNAIGALQGRVAGLSITSQSGEPGAGFNIKIRGNNSINAGTSPLIVIDGMQMNVPNGAFYAFPSYDYDIKSADFAKELVKAGLICSPGSAFGPYGENHLRFSYAADETKINKGMDILSETAKRISRK